MDMQKFAVLEISKVNFCIKKIHFAILFAQNLADLYENCVTEILNSNFSRSFAHSIFEQKFQI
jgi:hypothetical protein